MDAVLIGDLRAGGDRVDPRGGNAEAEEHLDLILAARRIRGLDAVRGGFAQTLLELGTVFDGVDAESVEQLDVAGARRADDTGAEAEGELGGMMPTPPEAPETKIVSPACGAIARMPATAVLPATLRPPATSVPSPLGILLRCLAGSLTRT
ncbi:hypothetical protein GCM10009713_04850 [Brevibacterium celere]